MANSTLGVINRQSSSFTIVPLEIRVQLADLTSLGFSIPANYRLRTLDSIQLLAADIAKARVLAQDPTADFIFVSADIKLLQVAQSQGFVTENPENYP